MSTHLAMVLLATVPMFGMSARHGRSSGKNNNGGGKAPTPPPVTITSWSMQPKTSPQMCNYTTTLGWSLKCTGALTDSTGETLSVNAAGGQESWKVACSNQCAVIAQTPGKMCTGFVFRGPGFKPKQNQNQCVFWQCDVVAVPDTNDVAATIYDPKCLFTNSPTTKPSKWPTSRPTRLDNNATPTPTIASTSQNHAPTLETAPTLPPTTTVRTNAPVPTRPTRPTTLTPTAPTPFTSPTNIPPSWPLDETLFMRDNVDQCYLPRVVPNAATVTWTDWTGTVDNCLKECQYDSQCFGIQFSSLMQTCIKATQLDTTDDATAAATYVQQDWVTYHKIAMAPELQYFNSYCVMFVFSKTCSLMTGCGWDTGKLGYNQVHAFNRGYCGRTSC